MARQAAGIAAEEVGFCRHCSRGRGADGWSWCDSPRGSDFRMAKSALPNLMHTKTETVESSVRARELEAIRVNYPA